MEKDENLQLVAAFDSCIESKGVDKNSINTIIRADQQFECVFLSFFGTPSSKIKTQVGKYQISRDPNGQITFHEEGSGSGGKYGMTLVEYVLDYNPRTKKFIYFAKRQTVVWHIRVLAFCCATSFTTFKHLRGRWTADIIFESKFGIHKFYLWNPSNRL